MGNEGFEIEVSSRYDGWWRYNVALMCGCFDDADRRTGFAAASSHVADAGADLEEPPVGIDPGRTAKLETEACDHLLLYVYIVPHTLPRSNDIDDTEPFDVDIDVSFGGRRIGRFRRSVNQWSGASIEMRIDREPKGRG